MKHARWLTPGGFGKDPKSQSRSQAEGSSAAYSGKRPANRVYQGVAEWSRPTLGTRWDSARRSRITGGLTEKRIDHENYCDRTQDL